MELTSSLRLVRSVILWCLILLPTKISCKLGRSCEELRPPDNGVTLQNSVKPIYRTSEVICKPGYRLYGSRWRICTSIGKWTGVPAKCEDIDECSIKGKHYPCHHNADCINTIGSYRCICLPGYNGDGTECKRSEQNLIRKVSDTCGLVEVKNDTSISRKRFRRVVSGQDSYPGEWPWQASIEIKKKVRLPFIAGALVKPGWILTVASQLYVGASLVSASDIKVILGDYSRQEYESHEQRFEVDRIFIHPKFDREKVSYDIALLKLKKIEKRTTYVNAICLVGGRKARMFESREHLATVTGWGTTKIVDIGENPGAFSRTLKQTTLPLQNARTCKKATAYNFHSRSMICAGYISGTASPCFGDHGAPLVIQDPYSRRWVLIGLYSWSEGCGRREKFSYYTRVSKFRRWITGLIRMTS